MTAQAFNVATCSDQDFAARMAIVDSCLASYSIGRTARNDAAERYAQNLHIAMGWRAEHLAELEF